MKNKIYLSYQTRLIITITMIVISTIVSLTLLFNSFNLFENSEITYTEKSEINYTVLLKDNNLLEEKEMTIYTNAIWMKNTLIFKNNNTLSH